MRVLLVTGFLGAGKTTFINSLIRPLRGNPNLALLVNDFGKESVSAEYGSKNKLLVRYLEGGCICCAIGPSLIETIRNLSDLTNKISSVVIELNGIARPDQTKQTLALIKEVDRPSTCCVINTYDFENLVSDPFYRELLDHQVEHSDFVFLNNIDDQVLPDPKSDAKLRRVLGEINPSISYLNSSDNSLDRFFPLGTFVKQSTGPIRSIFRPIRSSSRENPKRNDFDLVHLSVSFQYLGTTINLENEPFWRNRFGYELIRAKVMIISDIDRPRLVTQFSGRRWSFGTRLKQAHDVGQRLEISSLCGDKLTATIVLKCSEKSIGSDIKSEFLKTMRTRVLNLREL
jgi:G3E family GTPase